MDVKSTVKKITDKMHRYRYALLVVLIGLILMILPNKKTETSDTVKTVPVTMQADRDMEENLSEILSKIQGAGDVYVMLTTTRGEEIIYQTDHDDTRDPDKSSNKTDTVTVTDANRNETGLIRQTNPPKYLGAIVVCSGADDPSVRLSIVDAVSKVTGIGTNRISVLKMK